MSKVFFISLKVKEKGFLEKIDVLLEKSGLLEVTGKDHLTGIKIHFGEKGNTSYIRPIFVKNIAKFIATSGANPFLFDTTTLYKGARSNAVNHIRTAHDNGFNLEYPILIGAEYCFAVSEVLKGRMFYINFLLNVTPSCDCFPISDTPIVPDIGVLASMDPVAIDQASCDLVNNSIGIENSRLKKAFGKGEDKFRDLFNEVDWEYGLQYAESMGLGKRKYTLKEIT